MCFQFNCSFRHRLRHFATSLLARLKYAKNTRTHTMGAIKIHSMAIKPDYRQTKPYQINRSPSQAIGQEKPPKPP